jgi:hypothetical protein
MVVCALPFVRRSGHFEVFSWSHRLYVVFLVALVLHAPAFWHYLTLPGILLVLELLSEYCAGTGAYHRAKLLALLPLPSGVTKVVIKRPSDFEFRTGRAARRARGRCTAIPSHTHPPPQANTCSCASNRWRGLSGTPSQSARRRSAWTASRCTCARWATGPSGSTHWRRTARSSCDRRAWCVRAGAAERTAAGHCSWGRGCRTDSLVAMCVCRIWVPRVPTARCLRVSFATTRPNSSCTRRVCAARRKCARPRVLTVLCPHLQAMCSPSHRTMRSWTS